jgi:nucleoside-diphosphate-sugar epimerase
MPPREAVAVTGAAGFLGRPISRALADRKDLRLFGREARQTENGAVRALDDMSGLSGVSCVVHLAGIPTSQAPEADILRVNVDLACDVARAAGAAGVERFILFSSLHVHGKATGACIGPESPFAPHNAYGRSKVQAEEAVGNICRETGMRLVILRPPMIYGPGGRGSFFQLLAPSLIWSAVRSQRSITRSRRAFSARPIQRTSPRAI